MDVSALRRQLEADEAAGDVPCLVVGTAGSVGTGAVDPLPDHRGGLQEHGAWFHVDGAYGGLRPRCPTRRMTCAAWAWPIPWRSIRTSGCMRRSRPGCALVRDPEALRAAFAYHPPYYHFDERATNYVDYARRTRAASAP